MLPTAVVLGIINHRDKVIPVIEFAARFGLLVKNENEAYHIGEWSLTNPTQMTCDRFAERPLSLALTGTVVFFYKYG
jgi:hypothetical protein